MKLNCGMWSRTAALSVIGLLGAGQGIASAAMPAPEPSIDELRAQLDVLQAKVNAMESEQAPAASKAEVDAAVAEVMADAQQRTPLLFQDAAMTGGWEKGRFVLRSADGNYVFNPQFLLNVRHVTNYRDEPVSGADDDIQNGFEIRRMRPIFSGNAGTPKLFYFFQLEQYEQGGSLFLQDAWVRYKLRDNVQLKLGQFKDPAWHELVAADQYLLTERSLNIVLIGGGQTERIQGASIIVDPTDETRLELVAHDGGNSDNTNFTDRTGGTAYMGGGQDYGFTGRFEYWANGKATKAYDDFTARGNTDDLLVIGAGATWTQGGDSSALFHTADVQWENTNGLGVYGSLTATAREINDEDFYDYGGMIQAGYMLNDKCELFGRYGITVFDDEALAADAEDTFNEFTGGVNYYYNNHNVKLTVDLTYLPDGVPSNLAPLGFLASEEGEFVLRGTFQLLL